MSKLELTLERTFDSPREDADGVTSTVAVEFRERGGRTTVVLTQTGLASEESRDNHEDGWTKCLANLETRCSRRSGNDYEGRNPMTEHPVATREEWLAARRELLDAEKELTRRSDELARRRQELPWVRIEKRYEFETDDGPKTLAELFDGRSQLLIYHFMFGPDWDEGCPSCTSIAEGFERYVVHLNHHDVTMTAVSRAPLDKLDAYKRRMGWTFPWASSLGSTFNFDFGVSYQDRRQAGDEYNFGSVAGDDRYLAEELPGMSAFVLDGTAVYHTYSAYARGLDGLWGIYQWLDRAPKGRNEADDPEWMRRRDQYQEAGAAAR